MNLRDLVGKKVIRTAPYMDENIIHSESLLVSNDRVVEIPDYSFCDCHTTMIEVLEVVQDTPIVRIRNRKGNVNQEFEIGYIRAISGEYDDSCWKDVSEVYNHMQQHESKIKDEILRRVLMPYIPPFQFDGYREYGSSCGMGILHHNMLSNSNFRYKQNTKEDSEKEGN